MSQANALTRFLRARGIEKYGTGIPFVLAILGSIFGVIAAPGVATFDLLGLYAKIGVVMLSSLAAICVFAAGYTYQALDKSMWLPSRGGDGPVGANEVDDGSDDDD